MKDDFLEYIGPVDSLRDYSQSYKLVFYKCFFELLGEDNSVPTEELTERFQQYYIDRKHRGLIPDVNVDKVIQEPENSSLDSVYRLILHNPFAAISKRGYITEVTEDGKTYFVLNEELQKELTSQDIEDILNIVDKKLSLYFSGVDDDKVDSSLQDMINHILEEFVPAKSEPFSGHPIGVYFRKDIPQILYQTGIVDSKSYLISGSVGQGTWAAVPWVCIFDRRITTSATKGEYIAYLLSKDGNSLYLAFLKGCTEIRNTHTKKESISILRQWAADVIEKIDSRGFHSDEDMNLGSGLTDLAEFYQRGTVFYKEYKKGLVPEETELRGDLQKMMDIYQNYIAEFYGEKEKAPEPEDVGGEEALTVGEIIDNIKAYIAAKGFRYEDGLIENFYLSLKSKPFVILAGTSGTGKTRLVRLFAEAAGAAAANGRYKMVSVRPDWSDSSDLFGHVDLNGNFVPGAILDFVKQAESDQQKPYFLCLDEMNLARVEYYLSDILSVIETRDMRESGEIVSDPLITSSYYGTDATAAQKYGTVRLPENLYIIGTVNMDETTFPFSRKVLDRANTIEFSYVDLLPGIYEPVSESLQVGPVGNDFLKSEYLILNQCTEDWDAVTEYCTQLQQINKVLQRAGAHVGYRVRDEIVFYLLNNKKYALLPEDTAFDYELMQKILPRIQGSSASVKDMLCDLFKICAGDYDGYQTQSDDISSKMMKALDSSRCKYRRSAEKIAFMVRRFEEDGFTSYWL